MAAADRLFEVEFVSHTRKGDMPGKMTIGAKSESEAADLVLSHLGRSWHRIVAATDKGPYDVPAPQWLLDAQKEYDMKHHDGKCPHCKRPY